MLRYVVAGLLVWFGGPVVAAVVVGAWLVGRALDTVDAVVSLSMTPRAPPKAPVADDRPEARGARGARVLLPPARPVVFEVGDLLVAEPRPYSLTNAQADMVAELLHELSDGEPVSWWREGDLVDAPRDAPIDAANRPPE